MALVASVLIWAAPGAQAANPDDPIAVPVVTKAYDSGTTTFTVTLSAAQSFDPEDVADTDRGISRIVWKALKPYDWVTIANNADTNGPGNPDVNATDITTTVTKAQRDLFGSTIEFELTVTDDDNPSASATRKASVELSDAPTIPPATGKAPTVSVTVSAMQKDPAVKTDKLADYTVDAVISSSSDEWRVKENSLLVLDASGSTDPDTDNSKLVYSWSLLSQFSPTETIAYTDSNTGCDSSDATADNQDDVSGLRNTGDKSKLSTDNATSADSTETLCNISAARSPFTAIYRVTVSDGPGANANSADKVVRIVIVDEPAAPRITSVTSTDDGVQTAISAVGGYDFVQTPAGVNDGMVLTVAAADADGTVIGSDAAANLSVRWSGDATGTGASVTLDPTVDAKEGDEYTVTVTVTDPAPTRHSVSKTIKILAMTNTIPEVTIPSPRDNAIDVPGDGANSGYPKLNGMVVLTGSGSDTDGSQGPLSYQWRELGTAPAAPATPTGAECSKSRVPTGTPPAATALPNLVLTNADSPSVSFSTPEIAGTANRSLHFCLTATDKYGVSGYAYVGVTITADNDSPKADAGKDRTVSSGEFVRLDGSGSSDPDGDPRGSSGGLSYWWEYIGIETTPRTEDRAPVTDAEKAQGFTSGQWFPFLTAVADDTTTGDGSPLPDSNDDDALDDAAEVGDYHPTAGGKFTPANAAAGTAFPQFNTGAGSNRYPYFYAPTLTGFGSVKLTFRVTVTDAADATAGLNNTTDNTTASGDNDLNNDGLVDARVSSDTVTITVESGSKVDADSKFYSGLTITGPSFCANLSVGGPALVAADVKWNSTGEEYPPDVLARDKDNIADTCVLPTTRRATVATQNVLHQLANLYPTAFSNELHKTGGPCATALATVEAAKAVLEAHGTVAMDSADALAADSCGNGRKQVSSNAIPAPADLGLFYSGAIVGGPWDGAPINGPDACTNFGLGGGVGGTWVYAADMKDNATGEAYPMGTGTSARDGIADSCVLPFTLREAVARQKALDIFKGSTYTDLYNNLMKQECRKLTGFPSDKPYDLATDACVTTPTGDPLP